MSHMLLSSYCHSQSGICIELNSQAAVDSWANPIPISWNGSIRISGEDITNVDSLYSLISVIGFSPCNGAEALVIENNPLLTNLDGLANLEQLGSGIRIENNPLLSNIDSLQYVTSTSKLVIKNNPSLAHLQINFRLTGDTEISIIDNPSLMSIDSSSNTFDYPALNNIVIDNNDALTALPFLEAVAEVYGNVQISNNESLENLDCFSNLEFIEDSLTLHNNAVLTSLSGFSNLIELNSLHVSDNVNIKSSDFCTFSDLCVTNPPSNIVITGNLGNPTLRELQSIGQCATFKIGPTGYSTLEEALLNSEEHDFIYMTEDYTINTPVTFPDTNEVTLITEPDVTLTIDGADFTNDGIIVNHGIMDFINGADLTTRTAIVNTGTINLE